MGKKKAPSKKEVPGFTTAIRFEGRSYAELLAIQEEMNAPSLEAVLKNVMDIGMTVLLMSVEGNFDQFVFRNSQSNKIAMIDDLLKTKLPQKLPTMVPIDLGDEDDDCGDCGHAAGEFDEVKKSVKKTAKPSKPKAKSKVKPKAKPKAKKGKK